MDTLLLTVKNYFFLMLVLIILSHLAPAEGLRRYFRFFIGVWICVCLVRPLLNFWADPALKERDLIRQMEDIPQWQEREEDIFEFLEMEPQRKE